MKCNVGGVDRVLRILIGVGLLLWAIFGLSGTGQWIVGVVSLIPLVTGLFGYCPLYRVLKISTCKVSTP